MFKKLFIYDFDGTLVDSSHRYKGMICADGVERIDLAHWIANEYRVLDDTLLPEVKNYLLALADPAIFVVIATARIWCDLSKEFVRREGIQPQHVIARRDRKDDRGGAALKIEGVNALLESNVFTEKPEIHVFEDNLQYLQTLCDYYRARGHYFPSNQGH